MKKFSPKMLAFTLCLLTGITHAQVYVGAGYYGGGYYGGNYHGHPNCWGGCGWGGGPNVIINVPVVPAVPVPPPPYVVQCETFEVCDNYTDECWLEKRCN